MDNRAKNINTQTSDHLINISSSSQRLNSTDDHDYSNIQHLAIAKYLPEQTFKHPHTLNHALNQIERDTKNMPRTSRISMLENLAKNIALTTTELNIDYGTKLGLIHTALSHRLFRSRIILRLLKPKHRTSSQQILDTAITNIQSSRNHIILC